MGVIRRVGLNSQEPHKYCPNNTYMTDSSCCCEPYPGSPLSFAPTFRLNPLEVQSFGGLTAIEGYRRRASGKSSFDRPKRKISPEYQFRHRLNGVLFIACRTVNSPFRPTTCNTASENHKADGGGSRSPARSRD